MPTPGLAGNSRRTTDRRATHPGECWCQEQSPSIIIPGPNRTKLTHHLIRSAAISEDADKWLKVVRSPALTADDLIAVDAEVDLISERTAEHRRETTLILREACYPKALATSASHAPGPYLRDALLGHSVTWPGCDPRFDHAAFNEHVRSTWQHLPGWASNVYCYTAPSRQALVDMIASLGGAATMERLEVKRERWGLARNDLYLISKSMTRSGNTPPWPASVERRGDWSKRSPRTESILANWLRPLCGDPATAVVRVPEVPDALLCRRCRVMPSRPDLIFPPPYLDHALPTITPE